MSEISDLILSINNLFNEVTGEKANLVQLKIDTELLKDEAQTLVNNFNNQIAVQQVITAQTRNKTVYTALSSGDGTAITELDLIITPKKTGNKVILDFVVNYESSTNIVFLVARNGVLLTNATNDRWAGVASGNYDVDLGSTITNSAIKIIDNDSLDIPSTYSLFIRTSYVGNTTFYLNRTIDNLGQNEYETTLSTAMATEVSQ